MTADANDGWSIATGEGEGDKPLIVRIRNNPPAFVRKEEFPYLLEGSWNYEPANEHGMPSAETLEQMTQFETLLEPALEGSQQGFATVIVTCNGVRELQWYVRDLDDAMEAINKALAECEPFPVEFGAEEDPEWEAYTQFLEAMK